MLRILYVYIYKQNSWLLFSILCLVFFWEYQNSRGEVLSEKLLWTKINVRISVKTTYGKKSDINSRDNLNQHHSNIKYQNINMKVNYINYIKPFILFN